MAASKISEVGEKELIRGFIKPLLNPLAELDLAGDDCAVVPVPGSNAICISTDRVPADLISFRLKLIDHEGLGHYLAVLNLSDIASMGADPIGLLLNLALPPDLPVEFFRELVRGAKRACDNYSCRILGGDLSSSSELSISATSIGIGPYDKILRRKGSQPGDLIYCTDYIGLTSSAFNYFLLAKKQGLELPKAEEDLLADQFRLPKARFTAGLLLRDTASRPTCMDNTDGIGQTLAELSEINSLHYELDTNLLPIHDVTYKIADLLNKDPIDMALGPGADFQLLGTLDSATNPQAIDQLQRAGLKIIGRVTEKGDGVLLRHGDYSRSYQPRGWDYFSFEPTR